MNNAVAVLIMAFIGVFVILIGIETMNDVKYKHAQDFLTNCMCCCPNGDCWCSDTYYDVHENKCVVGMAGIRTVEEPINNLSSCQWSVIE